MLWHLSHRAGKQAVKIADRHYSRQKPGTSQFVKPGRCVVFKTTDNRAVWATSWPYPEYVKHQWPGAWECSLFHSEDAGLASNLIVQAVAATRSYFGEPPELGFITSINPLKVRPVVVRGAPTFGFSWLKCGWKYVGRHKDGQLVFQLTPERMPLPEPCHGMQLAFMELLAGGERKEGSDP